MTHTTLDLDRLAERVATRSAPVRRALTGPLLVAGRDDDVTGGALTIAELLARRDRVNAHVLTLVPPLPFTASLLTDIDAAALEAGRLAEQRARVRQRVHQTVGRSAHFSTSAELGSPARAIAREARERRSALIIVGLKARGAAGRAATEDAALQVTRTAAVPVLAVPPDYALLPRRALVGMDFGSASVRAARAALLTVAAGGRLTLAHVAPALGPQDTSRDGWGEIYAEGVAGLYRRLVPELRAPGNVAVETTVLEGDPTTALAELAWGGGFDLVAVGSRAAPWPESDLTGSVSAAVLRGVGCAVLIAPP